MRGVLNMEVLDEDVLKFCLYSHLVIEFLKEVILVGEGEGF